MGSRCNRYFSSSVPKRLSLWVALLILVPGQRISADSAVYESWSEADRQGWVMQDASVEGFEGAVEVTGDGIRVLDDQGEVARTAMLRHDEPFVPTGDCVRVDFTLALRELGTVDDSSAQYSSAYLYFSFNGVGLDLHVTGDRFIFDPQWGQYQMARSDADVQVFSFLLDTRRKLVRVLQDGRPLGLYRAYDLPEPGIRVTAQGSAQKAADILIQRIEISDAEWDNAPHTDPVAYQQREVLPAEWPTQQRDPRNTNHSPLKGTSTALEVINEIPIGGDGLADTFVADLTGDGAAEIIVRFGGRWRAYSLAGELLWQRTGGGAIVGLYDLDGDGRNELVLNPLVALDAATGEQKYAVTLGDDGEPVAMGCWQFADLNARSNSPGMRDMVEPLRRTYGNGSGMQAIFFPSHGDEGYVYSFVPGEPAGRRELTFPIAEAARGFTPSLALADVDDDSLPEIVCVTYDRAYAISLRDGRPRMFHYWTSGRCYAELVVSDIDDDPYPELIVQATNLREHLSVLDNDGLNLNFRWQHFYEQNYPQNNKDYVTCFGSVQDFDGDGDIEIVQSLYNDTGDERWHTLLIDAQSGGVERDLPDVKIIAVTSAAAGDDTSWLILTRAASRTTFSGLEAHHVEAGRTFAISVTGSLLRETSSRDVPINIGITGGWPSSRPMTPPGLDDNQLLMVDGRSLAIVTLPKGDDDVVDVHPLLSIPQEGAFTVRRVTDVNGDGTLDALVSSGTDRTLRVYSGGTGAEIVSLPAGGARRMAIAARLRPDDEQLTVLVVDWRNHLQAWTELTSEPRMLWEKPIVPRRGIAGPATVSVLDIEGDGTREILTGLSDSRAALLDPDGNVIRQWTLDHPVYDWAYGNFNGDDVTDLAVMTSPRVTEYRTFMLDPASTDDTPIWSRELGTYYGFPAVHDANGDGIDDIILRYFFMRHILDGRNGIDLQPVSWIQGYHCPAVVFPWGDDGEAALLMSGGGFTHRLERLDGSAVWSEPRSEQHRRGAIGDFDGDGSIDSAAQTIGNRYTLDQFKPYEQSFHRHLFVWDVASGEQRGQIELPGAIMEGLASADLDGDGRDEILAGTDNGRLLVVGFEDGDLTIESSRDFGAAVGRPVVVDVDLNGDPEVLVGSADGRLYVLGERSTGSEASGVDRGSP